MTWFRLCDTLPFHRKVMQAGNEAVGAWARAGAWSSGNLTEGYIPPEIAAVIAPPQAWADLRAAGLTEAPPDGRPGEQLHDFLEYNPTAETVRAERQATKERVQKFRAAKRQRAASNAVTPTVTNGVRNGGCTPSPIPIPIPDQIPPTPQGGDGTAPSSRTEKRQGGSETRYRAAYEAGIREGSPAGQAFVLPPGKIAAVLGPALTAHAIGAEGPLRGDDLLAWIRSTAAEYRRATASTAQYEGGWDVFHFAKWLNKGRPRDDAPLRPRGQAPIVAHTAQVPLALDAPPARPGLASPARDLTDGPLPSARRPRSTATESGS